MDYLNFELKISDSDGEFFLVSVRSPVGNITRHAKFPFTDEKLEHQLLQLENAILRSTGQWRRKNTPQEDGIQQLGEALFQFLFSDDVLSLYRTCRREAAHNEQGVRLRLYVQSPTLSELPWEFLFDPQRSDFVCLDTLSPFVRYLDLPHAVDRLTVTPPLRILGMTANPHGLDELDTKQEKRRIDDAVSELQAAGLVELIWLEGQDWRALQRAMREGQGPWHIFHFIGHAAFDTEQDEGLLYFADADGNARPISATQLSRLLAGQRRSLRLVLLNACESARVGMNDIFSSTAATLVRGGIPAVLAMQYEITERAAVELARTFYEAIADGQPVDVAVTEARNAINQRDRYSLEWGTPVLFMRAEDGRIFEFDVTSPEPVEEPSPLYVIEQRRFEAAIPASAPCNSSIDLIVRISLLDSTPLSNRDFRGRERPTEVQHDSRSMDMSFPLDSQTGRVSTGTVTIEVDTQDFEVANPVRKVRVPPDRDSEPVLFRLGTIKTGLCQANVIVYDSGGYGLGTAVVDTDVLENISKPAGTNIQTLILNVNVIHSGDHIHAEIGNEVENVSVGRNIAQNIELSDRENSTPVAQSKTSSGNTIWVTPLAAGLSILGLLMLAVVVYGIARWPPISIFTTADPTAQPAVALVPTPTNTKVAAFVPTVAPAAIVTDTPIPPTPTLLPTFTPIAPTIYDGSAPAILEEDSFTLLGKAKPDSKLEILVNNAVFGETTVDEKGFWELKVRLDEPGEYLLSVRGIYSDTKIPSADKPALVIVPSPTSTNTPTPANTPTSTFTPIAPTFFERGVPDVLQDGSFLIFGQAQPAATLEILANEVLLGETMADDEGEWEFEVMLNDPGEYLLSVRSIYSDTEIPSADEPVSVIVPSPTSTSTPTPTYTPTRTSTATNTPTATWTPIAPMIDPTSVARMDINGRFTISGAAAPGHEVEILVNDTLIGSTNVDAGGAWTFEVLLDEPGEYLLSVRAIYGDTEIVSTGEPTLVIFPSPTPTNTPAPTRAVAATYTPTSIVTLPSAITVIPVASEISAGDQTFSWTPMDRRLAENEYYELVFWPAGGDPMKNGFGPIGSKKETSVTVSFNDHLFGDLPQLQLDKEYDWGVLLVERDSLGSKDSYVRIAHLGTGNRFKVPSGGGISPSPTNPVKPN